MVIPWGKTIYIILPQFTQFHQYDGVDLQTVPRRHTNKQEQGNTCSCFDRIHSDGG